jgi:hypothetical protein
VFIPPKRKLPPRGSANGFCNLQVINASHAHGAAPLGAKKEGTQGWGADSWAPCGIFLSMGFPLS